MYSENQSMKRCHVQKTSEAQQYVAEIPQATACSNFKQWKRTSSGTSGVMGIAKGGSWQSLSASSHPVAKT